MSVKTDVPKYTSKRNENNTSRVINPDYVALWESYLDEGMAAEHVAELFGVHKTTVRRYYPHKVWTMDQARELSLMNRKHNHDMQKAQALYA